MNIKNKIEKIDNNINKVREKIEIKGISLGYEIIKGLPVFFILYRENMKEMILKINASKEFLQVGKPYTDGMAMIAIGQLCEINESLKTKVIDALGHTIAASFIELYYQSQDLGISEMKVPIH